MTVKFQPLDLPVAYSMIRAARRLRRLQDNNHPFQKFFYYWSAFNNIYTTIAYTGNKVPKLKKNPDGSIVTNLNGNVQIPVINKVSEKDQIELTLAEFDDDLKCRLITHPSTKFFVNRIPKWEK